MTSCSSSARRLGRPCVLLLEHLEHAPRDEEAAEDVDRGERDREHAHRLAERAVSVSAAASIAPTIDDRRDRVGHRHQRRVQRRRDGPHDVVADVDREHEDDQVGDGRETVERSMVFSSLLALDFAVLRHQAGGDDVVVHRHVEACLPSSSTSFRKSSTLRAYSALASAATSAGRLVSPTIVTPCLIDGLAGFGERAVAALRRGHVDDHRAGLHRLDHLFGDQHRRRRGRGSARS